MSIKTGFLCIVVFILMLCNPCRHCHAQIITVVYDTLCSGDTLHGYYNAGVYRDTFSTGNGDSIRELHIRVVPHTGISPLPLWFNTGTNGMGGRLPGGSPDMNWKVGIGIDGPYAPAIVITDKPTGAYGYAPSIWPDCDWIAHSASGLHTGNMDYYYRIDFELPCFDSCGYSFDSDSTFCLGLDFFADNSVFEIYVNGVPQSPFLGGIIPIANPYQHEGYRADKKVSLTLCRNWKRGYNTLVIHIASAADHAGFLAQASVNSPPPPSPVRAGFELAVSGSGPPDTGCAPFPVQFVNTSVSATGYTWDFGDGTPVSHVKDPLHTYADPGVYTVTLLAVNEHCGYRQDTARTTVAVYRTEMPDIEVSDTLVCRAGAITLRVRVNNPDANNRFLWQPATGITGPADQSLVTVDPSLHTSYSVIVWDTIPGICGFSASDTIRIDYAPRALAIYNSDTTVCEGAVVTVQGAGTPGYTYRWQPGEDFDDSTLLSPEITVAHSGTYTVTGSYPGCPDTSLSLTIDMQPYPVVALAPDTSVCQWDIVRLSAHVTPPRNDYSYHWQPAAGLTGTGGPEPHFRAEATATYVLTVSTPAGCSGSDEQLIEVYPGDFGSITADTGYCPPDSVQLLAGGGILYAWSPAYGLNDTAIAGPVAAPESGTEYTVFITGEHGCMDTLQVRIDVYPRAVVSLPDTILIYPGMPRYLEPAGNGLYFKWFPHGGLSSPFISNPRVYPETDTRYYVTVITEHGCIAGDSVDVRVQCTFMDIPNAFTPGNGSNNTFNPVRSGLARLNRFAVFNRWGSKVFETDNTEKGWDGTYNGVPQPLGVYVYLIDAVNTCGESFTRQGNVSLLR